MDSNGSFDPTETLQWEVESICVASACLCATANICLWVCATEVFGELMCTDLWCGLWRPQQNLTSCQLAV